MKSCDLISADVSCQQPNNSLRRAMEMLAARVPSLPVDGEIQANTALVAEILNGTYPFNRLGAEANLLIFPSLEAGNIGYKLVQQLAQAEVKVKDIVNLAALAVLEAQKRPLTHTAP